MNLGTALYVCRTQRRLSLEELGRRAHYSPSYISKLENGKRNVTLSCVRNICAVLGLPEFVVFFLAAGERESAAIDIKARQQMKDAILETLLAGRDK